MAASSKCFQRALSLCLLVCQLLLDAGQKRVCFLALLGAFGSSVVQSRLLMSGRVQLSVFFLKGLDRCLLRGEICFELGDALGQGGAVSVCLLEAIQILLSA